MAIEYRRGDLFKHRFTTNSCLLHGCNAKGVMGSGFAKTFKQKYPRAYENYVIDGYDGSLKLGYISFTVDRKNGMLLASAVTQESYGKDGKRYVDYQAVADVIKALTKLEHIDEVVMPKIGSGLGGGDWEIIEKIITILNYRRPELKFVIYEL